MKKLVRFFLLMARESLKIEAYRRLLIVAFVLGALCALAAGVLWMAVLGRLMASIAAAICIPSVFGVILCYVGIYKLSGEYAMELMGNDDVLDAIVNL